MGGGQGTLPPSNGVAIRRSFPTLSVKPSLPLRASSLQSVPQVHKPSLPLRAASETATITPDSISHAQHALFFRDPTQTGGKHTHGTHGRFAASTPTVHPVLALRYKWRTACAKALKTDTPHEHFLSAIQHRGLALPAPVKTDAARPLSSASLSWRRGSAAHLHAPRAPRDARAASVIDAPPTPSNFPPAAAATRRRSYEEGKSTWRTERNTLMPPPPRLPGPLRCAKAHAPRVRGTSTSLAAS
ncbi:hypothetical protein T484DRAFT_1914158 [Baffinella frigidus]|nr:hypothetical protein T484DRAFT_1914158 [Cryptophyta sp. CCMP2293]